MRKKEELESMNPLTHPENTYGNKVYNLYVRTNQGQGMALNDFISYLTRIRDEFGNMPVAFFNGRTGCYTHPVPSDVDVVKQYFTVSGNLDGCNVDIKYEKALSLFHS